MSVPMLKMSEKDQLLPVNRSDSIVRSFPDILEEYIRPCFAEFLGVTLFVFIGCTSVYNTGGNIVGIAFAHGLSIALLIIATGSISGGHLNPAVTLGILISGAITPFKAILYVVAQVLGGILGAGISRGVLGDELYKNISGGAHDLSAHVSVGEGVLCEVMLTAMLVTVILSSAVDPKTKNVLAPLGIGFTVVADILAGGGITGASMNPARSFGPAIVVSYAKNVWTNHWIYWVAPSVGASFAAVCYRLVLASPENRFIKPQN
ncbi:aquaporin-8-like isoform X1 [Biomphalaria glabrata]|uniref:Aquaporin-8-like isoform X1 n=2 Tax=Biomphalaria glabrata TaxID=6526 RepID=A0A9U8DW83_BIOGL|nr:aquaporin-8-like isoform X1 [Biomphalaria glabrata]KAI8764768.1 aquaporin-8-like isoform X1 [Biomphalaria glabrata]